MVHDESLFGISEKVKNFAVICKSSQACLDVGAWVSADLSMVLPISDTCDVTQVPDFTKVRLFALTQTV